eukprot:31556-Pelagococcus_subviridis.AAC.17
MQSLHHARRRPARIAHVVSGVTSRRRVPRRSTKKSRARIRHICPEGLRSLRVAMKGYLLVSRSPAAMSKYCSSFDLFWCSDLAASSEKMINPIIRPREFFQRPPVAFSR